MKFVETDKLDKQAVEQALKGVHDVLSDMGIPISSLRSIAGRDSLQGTMSANGFMDLHFSNAVFSSMEKAIEGNSSGYTVAKGIHGTGTHEAGHIVARTILNRTMKDSTNLQRAEAWKKGTIEKQILKEAIKKHGSNPTISKYGSTKPAEKIAEAVSDVYTNKSKANSFSRVIVDIMKKKLKG